MAKSLITGAKFFKMENVGEMLIGKLGKPVIRETDGKNVAKNPNDAKGSVMGYEITDYDGEIHIIGNSHQIQKAVSMSKEGDILKIVFAGKTTNAKNQPVNTFKIDCLESIEEWEKELGIDSEPEPTPVKKGKNSE